MDGSPLVIGGGRVGTAISRMWKPPAPLLARGQRVPAPDGPPSLQPAGTSGPKQQRPLTAPSSGAIWVCTTNDGLDSVLEVTPASRRPDLVFVQNGMLLPWLHARGLARNTQVLLYMAAHADGGVTDGGLTLVHGGAWAAHAARALAAGGVRCRVEADWLEFQRAMVVKLLWASIFWMMSAALGAETVGMLGWLCVCGGGQLGGCCCGVLAG